MGCGTSTVKAKVYAEDEDADLIAAFEPEFSKLTSENGKVPMDKLAELYDAVTEGAQALSEREKTAAVAKLDPNATGYFDLKAFVAWFQIPSQADAEPAPAAPEVHENVRKGLKDEGVAEGVDESELREMREARARAQAEAEAELRAMAAEREGAAAAAPPSDAPA